MGRRLRSTVSNLVATAVASVVVIIAVAAGMTTAAVAVPAPATATVSNDRSVVHLAEDAEGAGVAAAWIYPVPLDAAAGDQDRWRRVQQPRRRLVFPLSAESRYQLRKGQWRNWGGRTVRVRGQVRLCWSRCTDWHPGGIVLAGRRVLECAGEPATRYTRFRLRGFEGLAGGVYRARAGC